MQPSDDLIPLLPDELSSGPPCGYDEGGRGPSDTDMTASQIAQDVKQLTAVVQHLLQSVAELEKWRATVTSAPSAAMQVEAEVPLHDTPRPLAAVEHAMKQELDAVRLRVEAARQRETETKRRFDAWLQAMSSH